MLNDRRNTRLPIAIVLLLISVMMTAVYADDDADEHRVSSKKSRKPLVINAKVKEECGSCHMVYPPRFLSAESWRAVMAGLGKHFGSDASVDAATATEIGDFLVQNASTKQRKSSNGIEPALRITETRWFQSEHRKVENKWKDPRVKSAANCVACHTQADSGSFRERDLKVPK